MSRKFCFLEHPADIGIEASGNTLEEAFESAALGLYELMFESGKIVSRITHDIHLEASDLDALLVKWLNEVLYLFDAKEFVGSEIKVLEINEKIDDFSINAKIFGETFLKEKHGFKIGVKAVTYHQLKIERNDNISTIQVFFDI